MVKCILQDIEKVVHLQLTGRADPTEASNHIVLALETRLPRLYAVAHVQMCAQVCTPYLGLGTNGNRLTINSTST